MNAIELADELINWYPNINLCVASAITLRQQAKEIEQLKEKNEAMRFHIVHGEHMPQMSDFL